MHGVSRALQRLYARRVLHKDSMMRTRTPETNPILVMKAPM